MNDRRNPHRGRWGRTKTAVTVAQSDYTPIFVGTRVVGVVRGDTFHKRIRKNHFLQKPKAIAFDIASINQAEQAGAIKVRVTDRDSGIVYSASIRHIHENGERFNRGHGDQIFLVLEGWTKSTEKKGIQLRLLFE